MSVELFTGTGAFFIAALFLTLANAWMLGAPHRRYLRLLEAEQVFAAYAGKVHQLILVNLGVLQSKADELQALRSAEREEGSDVVH